ncbi:MAG: hypothetical protein NTU47_17510 [Ignavibacteriales bacterium]|nr:hypothetical protein [Ignavibacteriales bacterium]
MTFRSDPEKHGELVAELVDIFKERGYTLLGADGVAGLPRPKPLQNDGYGDQQAKAPDIYAYDENTRCYIIGEAKTGRGDFETDHALTQYNVFLDQFDKHTGAPAILFVIVPAAKIPEFNSLLTHYIHPDYWGKLVIVSSKVHET